MNSINKLLFLLPVLCCCICGYSQGDIIIIKKNDVPVKSFFSGGMAVFKTTSGEWINSRIMDIRDDSIFFKEVVIRQVMTQFGVTRMDTMTSYSRSLHYTEIAGIPKSKDRLHIKPESLMMIAGGGYAALNLVNSGLLHYAPFGRDNRPKLLPAVGVFAAGYIISRFRKDFLPIGKKYTLHYVRLRNP
jgi:hypothetical protein